MVTMHLEPFALDPDPRSFFPWIRILICYLVLRILNLYFLLSILVFVL